MMATQTRPAGENAAGLSGPKWADMTDWADEGKVGLERTDEEGNRIVTTYFRDADGRQMKCERKVAVVKQTISIPLGIAEREREMKPFGLERLDFERGDNKKYATSSSTKDEPMRPGRRMGLLQKQSVDDEFASMMGGASGGFEVNKKALSEITRLFEILTSKDGKQALNFVKEKNAVSDAALTDAYSTVESRRANMPGAMDTEDRTVRVTNLPEYANEDELDMLFNRVGRVQRLFLARNKETMVSKGFAFVTFYSRQDAQTAITKLHKHGFANVLLNVEWAKKKIVNPDDQHSGPSPYPPYATRRN